MNKVLLCILPLLVLAACVNHGKKVKSGVIEMYYREGITEDEAAKAAAAIEEVDKQDNNNTTTRRTFQLLRDGDTVTLRMVVDLEKAKNLSDANFLGIAQLISDRVFNGRPVNMDLTDKKFNTERHISYKKNEVINEDDANIAAFGTRIKEGNVEVYMKGSGEDEATAVANFMNSYFKPETTFSYQLIKDEAENYTVKMVGNPASVDKLDKAFFTQVCKGLCDALHVPAVRFEMTNMKFETLRSFNYPADTGDSDMQN